MGSQSWGRAPLQPALAGPAPNPEWAVLTPTLRQLHMNIVSEIGDIKNDNALLLQQGNLLSPRDRFRNPQPKINSNAQEFIKEARQSAFEKTHFQLSG